MMFSVSVLLAVATAVTASPLVSNGPTATVDSGIVVGIQTSVAGSPNLVNQYLGLPFAASPTRFAPAQTPTPWSQPMNVSQRGPACIQQFNYPEAAREFDIAAFNTPAPPESEDCLNVDIYVPAGAENNGPTKPVMFWIYGGALAFGYDGVIVYDGSSFAANQDVIIVAANYRTNVFGFPGALELPLTQRNLGYLDQRFALDWVQRNIHAFGGDPNQVTIFGESAGAFSVDALVTSYTPSNPPPFRGAIMESGQSSVTAQPPNNGSSFQTLVSHLNCSQQGFTDDLTCARAAPASTLKSIEEHLELSFVATPDNYTFLEYPNVARAEGLIYPVPILTGTNANEGALFTFTATNTTTFLTSLDSNLTSTEIQFIESVYPVGPTSFTSAGAPLFNDTLEIAAIYTDLIFQCPCAIVTNTSVAAGIPTWRYFYNSTFPNITPIPGVQLPYFFGVYHSSEIPLVFGTYTVDSFNTTGRPSEQEMRISEYMQTAWATFARNPHGGPGWTSAADGDYVQIIGGKDGFPTWPGSNGLTASADGAVLDGGRCFVWQTAYEAIDKG